MRSSTQGGDVDRLEADVFDISPILCPACRGPVGEEDAYCEACGTNLLEPLTRLCATCGKGLSQTSSYCSGCGTAVAAHPAVETIELPESAPGDVQSGQDSDNYDYSPGLDETESDDLDVEPATGMPTRKRRRWPYVVLAIALLIGGITAGWWYGYRQPDLNRFSVQLSNITALAASSQEATDSLADPSDLDKFSTEVDALLSETRDLQDDAGEVKDGGRREALENIATAEVAYLEELARLSELPSAEARPSEYLRVGELASELEGAFEDAQSFDASLEVPAISPSPLTSALADLASYRKEVIKERERARKINQQRAEDLAAVNAFTDQLDGIVSRYSAARADLAAWIDNVDRYGASFGAAYSKLDQQIALRSQLRNELAALTPPDPFGADQAALLAVMDRAITATQDAYRGIEEYQFDFNLRYIFYYETPGWRSFEAQTDEISDSYETVLANYEANKAETVKRLERRVPLPELPE